MKRYTITVCNLVLIVSSIDAESEEAAREDMEELGYWHYCNELNWDDAELHIEEEQDKPDTAAPAKDGE